MHGFDKWDARFMELAHTIANWASCYQENRKIGAVIVKNKRILTTGYNGARGREKLRGARRMHAAQAEHTLRHAARALLCHPCRAECHNTGRQVRRIDRGATLYCTHQPCVICAKMIVNSGISRVVYGEGYPDEFAMQMFDMAGVKIERYEEERN